MTPVLRDPEHELRRFRSRLVVAYLAIIIAFGILAGRFVWLQILRHDHYMTLAESNRITQIPVPPSRGVITDRNGVVLANDYSAYTLEIVPSRVPDLEKTIDVLSTLVEVTPKDRRRFKKLLEENKNFESLPLRTRLTDEEMARLSAHRYALPGVEIRSRAFRQYPFGESGSHVLGYIARVSQRDQERLSEQGLLGEYRGTDYIGKAGVELTYEKDLHGKSGFDEVEVDSSGRAVRVLSRKPPVAGNNLQLSLDIRLQQVAETAFGEKRGALVAIEPSTGDVLAFVSRPGYDPNLFVEGIDPENWKLLNESKEKPLLNRPLRGAYPPGSTFKPFFALAALESGLRTPTDSIRDPGFFYLSGSTHRFNDDKPGGHGIVDMYKSIVVSCDTYYYQLASEMDIDDKADFLRPLGFGRKTGIDIEGELSGVLPSREWKRKLYSSSKYREEHRKWYAGDSVSAGIGQGYNSATPLQLAHATANLANNGVVFKPHLVKAIQDSTTSSWRLTEPKPTATLQLSQDNVDTIKRAMVGVNVEGTSAGVFRGVKYSNGGKTGTAQVFSLRGQKYDASKIDESLRDHALFIAFAPADKPTIALAVLVENGGFGATAAAPIARKVLDFHMLGEPAPSTKESVAARVTEQSAGRGRGSR
jgi:penicillin-binding protein 2